MNTTELPESSMENLVAADIEAAATPAASKFQSTTKKIPSNLEVSRWNTYLLLIVVANIACLFFKGYPQDLAYWTDWVKQLSTNGYQNFNGNYPPIYIHWLYLLGKFYSFLNLPIEANLLLKLLTQIPVLCAHIALSRLVFNRLTRFNIASNYFHLSMFLVVFNPAILINGPIWGQVDLLPVYFACLAIIYGCDKEKAYWMIPLFVASLLTKFQMIALAPLFGFLFFRNLKQQLLGIFLSLLVIVIAFSPYLINGHFIQAFKQAYIDTLGQYPLTTFNAANIWILLSGNATPDTRVLFGEHQGLWKQIFTAKYFGIISFACLSIVIFILGLIKQRQLYKKLGSNSDSAAVDTYYLNEHLNFSFFCALLCALGFFFLLPAMHERYLFPAVIFAIVYFAFAQQKLAIPIMVSLISAFNMLIIVELNGSDIWIGLAWTLSLICLFVFIDFIFNSAASKRLQVLVLRVIKIRYSGIFISVCFLIFLTLGFAQRFTIHKLELNAKEIFLGDLAIIYAHQDHGNLVFNRSFDGNILSIGNKRYQKGLGTHANSEIQVALPETASEFHFMAGLDDEVGSAEVSFSVWGDGKLLWSSATYYGHETAKLIRVDVHQIKTLILKVDAKQDDRWDHADWINPVIELE